MPLLLSGPGVPAGHVETTPVSHVDLYPTIIEGAGLEPVAAESDLPGHSLLQMATRTSPVFAEYHAAGSRRGVSMLRDGAYKLIHHLDAPVQLFNLEVDPIERFDLATDPGEVSQLHRLERQLRAICDPALVDLRARADQQRKAEHWGGNETILKEGLLVYTPPPGVQAEIEKASS